MRWEKEKRKIVWILNRLKSWVVCNEQNWKNSITDDNGHIVRKEKLVEKEWRREQFNLGNLCSSVQWMSYYELLLQHCCWRWTLLTEEEDQCVDKHTAPVKETVSSLIYVLQLFSSFFSFYLHIHSNFESTGSGCGGGSGDSDVIGKGAVDGCTDEKWMNDCIPKAAAPKQLA